MMGINQLSQLKFDAGGLIPVVTQDCETKTVLMLAYANAEALRLTLDTKRAHYYSRSRREIWLKGETSGHFQHVADVRADCDSDALLYLVRQEGVACHTGSYSCFDAREANPEATEPDESRRAFTAPRADGSADKPADIPVSQGAGNPADTLRTLQAIVTDRRKRPREGSYTNYLFSKGLDKILKKVGEENAEVIIAAKNRSADELRYETADLLYHLTVLLTDAELSWEDICGELGRRFK